MVPYLALAFSVFGLLLAAISLAAHWYRGQEHPDVTRLRVDVADMLDKVEHWMKRDRVRRLRDSHEEPEPQPVPQPAEGSDTRAIKAALREKVFGRR